MPDERIHFDVEITLQDAMDACRVGAQQRGLSMKGEGPARLLAWKTGTDAEGQIDFEFTLSPAAEAATTVEILAKQDGDGLYSEALEAELHALRQEIETAAPGARKHDSMRQGSDATKAALAALVQQRDAGIITAEEYKAKEARLTNWD